ncbi:MAG: phosphotriesterase-related protein [Thermodesulfobacteriota bacterium]
MEKISKINTVTGPIFPHEMGITLVHEHVIFGYGGWYANYSITPFDREMCINTALDTIKELKTYGVKTVVDVTPGDCGRDPELLKEISEKSEMNIICSTGLYTEGDGGSGYFKFRKMVTGDATDEIYELFAKEIKQGIGTTGIKPGVIKVATGDGNISPYEEMVLRAAGRAQKETEVPIITHTGGDATMGIEQADLLISEGADPKRISIGHMNGSSNIQYHLAIVGKGVYIVFDRFGTQALHRYMMGLEAFGFSDELSKACVIGLISIGYEKRIMISHDYVWYFLGKTPINMNPSHIFKNIIPALKQAGVADEMISTIMVDNPRRLFTG